MSKIPHSMSFLLLRFLVRNLLLFWWDYLYTLIVFFSFYRLQYFFSVLCACCFNDSMLWGGFILVKSLWCPGGLLHLKGQNFLKFGKFYAIILWKYYIPLWLTPLLLQRPWFSGLFFWWSCWVLAYSFQRSWVVWLRFILFFFFL
jgi:hypothetical protein